MTPAAAHQIFEAVDATWPAAGYRSVGPWTIREGQGGGSRVSAATPRGPVTAQDVPMAEEAMRGLGQAPLFMITPEHSDLDSRLENAGYRVKDPVNIYAARVDHLTRHIVPPVTAFQVWPPIAALRDVWREGGTGTSRLAVMDRVAAPKTAFLGRLSDTPSGAVFAACHGDIAMLHALEVSPRCRRGGLGRNLVLAVAHWAALQGAQWLCLLVTQANMAANALYSGLGMEVIGGYHYRQIPAGEDAE